MRKNPINPINLPKIMLVIEIGADSNRGKVRLRRSSLINRMVNNGDTNNSTMPTQSSKELTTMVVNPGALGSLAKLACTLGCKNQ
ncbi:hypothetical protein BGP_6338 [Beggiatoa sp. PS]|nr:hypothetical protein BGP_6338 [Beggiatoa sp. PS]